ncbi:MAG: MBL fold metallo-hydrolase [Nitrospirae bacterium]|nr:MBL fold metallo-hydrolase [Nitrospirota bacterium]
MSNFKVISLASSSKGNCILIIAGRHKFFIDFGINVKELLRKLKSLRIAEPPDKILISHEHHDHTYGIENLSKNYRIKVFANLPTFRSLNSTFKMSSIEKEIFVSGSVFKIDSVEVKPFRIFHDAEEPVGFSISYKGSKVVYIVDAGRVTDENIKEMADSDLVIIDSNYDNLSLMRGKYPPDLKKRIMEYGHLSNEVVANIILNHPDPETEFWLAHLSEENNSTGLAAMTVNYVLKYGKGRKVKFKVLPRRKIGPVWEKKKEIQLEFLMPGLNIPDVFSDFLLKLDEEKRRMFNQNFISSLSIKDSDVREMPTEQSIIAWRVRGKREDGYVVARDIDLPGVDGIEIDEKIWACECGDFLWNSQRKGIPCKHMIKVMNMHKSYGMGSVFLTKLDKFSTFRVRRKKP